MNDTRPKISRRRKFLRIALYTIGSLLLLVVALLYALTLPPVQRRLTREAQSFLEKKLDTRVEIGSVGLRFPYHLSLEKFLLEDRQGDTLVRVGSLVVTVDMWKLLDQRIELQKITLEDASAYLHRKDSINNFDFIVQAFAGPDEPKPVETDTTASPWKLQIDLTVLQLKNVHFLMQDDDAKSTTRADIGTAETTLAKADLENMYFELDGFALADSDIRLIQTMDTPDDGEPAAPFGLLLKDGDIQRSHLVFSTPELGLDAALNKTTLDNLRIQSANDLMNIQAEGIEVENSAVAYRDPTVKPTPGHLNAGDLGLTRLNADLPQFSMQNDTLFVQVESLSGNDKSGIQVHSVSTIVQMTPREIQVRDAVASLNSTSLDGDILLVRRDSTFERMQVELRHVKGVVGDLLLLLPPLENQSVAQLRDMPYEASGNLSGWLDNLRTDKIEFRAGSGTVAFFTGSLQQLTDPEKLGMHLNVTRLQTNRTDLVQFMSLGDTPKDSILMQPLPAYVNASGTLDGALSRLQLNLAGEVGALQTGSDFPADPNPPLQFDLAGVITDASDPDKLGMDLEIRKMEAPHAFFAFLEPKGLSLPDLLQVTGTLRGTLAALNTDLNVNALRDGITSKLTFKGLLNNVQTPDQLGFDVAFDASLARREILGYVPDSVVTPVLRLPDFTHVSGQAKGSTKNATGKIEIALGNAGKIFLAGNLQDSLYKVDLVAQNLEVARLAADTSLRPLKMLSLNAHLDGEGFDFGETAKVKLNGKFDSLIWDNLILRDLRLAADVEGKRFTGTFESPDDRMAVRALVKGDFSTDIPLLETDININCMDLREFGWSNRPTTICMHLLSQSEGLSLDTLTAKITIENLDLQYDTVHVRPGNLTLDLKLDNHHNNIEIVSDWLQGEIKGFFSLADLSTTISNISEQYFVVDRTNYVPRVGTDSLFVNLRLLRPDVLTTGIVPGLTDLAPVSIEGSLIAQRNYFNLLVRAPRIVYQTWHVDSLTIRSYAGDSAALFVLTTPLVRRGNEDFIENAELNGQFVANKADVSFKATNDEGRDRFLFALEASIDGPKKETLVKFAPRQIIDFKEWAVDAENRIRVVPAGVEIQHFKMTGDGQSIEIEGNTKNSGKKTALDLAVDIDRLNYNNFDLLVAGTLRELGGWAEAHLKIGGTTDALQVRGRMQMHETFFTPVLTNVRYELSETPIEFTETGVNLNGLSLRDPYGKTLEINGKLTTKDWKEIQTNINLKADRWQVMNSTKQQNPVYYGEVYVTLNGTVRGPATQPEIQLAVKTDKESNFTYVYDAATQALQHEGIVYFLPPPRQYVRPPIYDAPVNEQPFTLSASIEIDSNLTINSVIDPVTGDDFRGKASGKLQLDILSNGNMTLAGRVELVRGVYNYSYQSVVKRSFDVSTGSTITWTGDITRPELDLKARYQFKASPYPLVVNQLSTASADEAAAYRRPQVFFLQTTINGSVTQPNIGFQFIYPSAETQQGLTATFSSQETGLVESALNNVNEDKNQLSKQVFSVLLLRNFLGETVGATATGGGGNPLQSGLTNFLTGQINALADQYLTWIEVDFTTTQGSSNTGATQAEGTTNYQLRLQKSFFEDRLTFRLSGGTTVGGSNGDDSHSALENASVEYALTSDGQLKVSVFSERGFELLNASSSNLRNSGAGFILSREFGGKR